MFHWIGKKKFFFLILGLIILGWQKTLPAQNTSTVYFIQLNDDMISPITADYIIHSVDLAEKKNAEGLVIKLDTPGGLLASTRLIVKKLLTAKIPVIVYIAPSGSRAGSAGVFITYASHVAAMAPSTNIGAAHPVQIGQETPSKENDWKDLKEMMEQLKATQQNQSDSKVQKLSSQTKKDTTPNAKNPIQEIKPDSNPMESKILQDTVAFIKAIAQKRGRNEEWAVLSVTKSNSITANEALEKKVVEIIAKNDHDLLNQLDGRVVALEDKEVVLKTKDAVVEYIPMDFRQQFFNILANPNIAYILLILGFYGLLFEITHPGTAIPGVVGAILMILAFYSMQTLPTNYAGLALMILGLILFITEIFVPGGGLLMLAGLGSLTLGSLLLFNSADPLMQVSKSLIFTFVGITALFAVFILGVVVKSRRRKVLGGKEGLVGMAGEAQSDIFPEKEGKVFVHGEIWNASSAQTIKRGEKIIVESVDGLNIVVKKKI